MLLLVKLLLDECPSSLPAAIEANLTAGLVSCVPKLQGRSLMKHRDAKLNEVTLALACLEELVKHGITKGGRLWTDAAVAGIFPVLTKLLRVKHEPTIIQALVLSAFLILPVPPGQVGSRAEGVPRAIAGLLTAESPVAGRAAAMLSYIISTHPKLVRDWPTWGINDALQRLTMHSDPDTAAAAVELQKGLSGVEQCTDVSSTLRPRTAPFPSPSFCCPGALLSQVKHRRSLMLAWRTGLVEAGVHP
jgi:hypothetical protein